MPGAGSQCRWAASGARGRQWAGAGRAEGGQRRREGRGGQGWEWPRPTASANLGRGSPSRARWQRCLSFHACTHDVEGRRDGGARRGVGRRRVARDAEAHAQPHCDGDEQHEEDGGDGPRALAVGCAAAGPRGAGGGAAARAAAAQGRAQVQLVHAARVRGEVARLRKLARAAAAGKGLAARVRRVRVRDERGRRGRGRRAHAARVAAVGAELSRPVEAGAATLVGRRGGTNRRGGGHGKKGRR